MAQRTPAALSGQNMALRETHVFKGVASSIEEPVSWQRFFGEDKTAAGHFLAIARCGSFNQVARRFGMRADILRKSITRLEQRLGSRVFVQKNSVLELTSAGKYLHTLVRDAFFAEGDSAALPMITPIRLSIPPMLLEGALFRSLISWLRKNAGTKMVLQDPLAEDHQPADLKIWIGTSASPVPAARTFVDERRLTKLGYLPHIAGSYASKRIIPCRLEDLEDYLLAQYQGFSNLPGLHPWNDMIARRRHGVIEVQSYDMLRELVRWSGCIGLLTDGTGGQNPHFMPLNGVFREAMALDVWIGVNPRSECLSEARRIMEMMAQACAE
ncbi:LysR family transcriptional regulator [Sodalis ligni]|uniref:DNA-binding transcriptional LysR family regulator n=1 Tax=Sodalis ligni TaxID=2697027 RepID=A0A4R1NE59_9GAMM|nr:LysR family transcriptional regulator [Sodalis ligni]TCL05884.1 DNA-binding transcriptional LysR family regulator [Sodalis ligni]